MKLGHRRVIYSSFILAFFVITSLTIIYAAGYSYNFKRGRVEKTGILYIESFPKDAKVFINDQFEDTTPVRFSRLLPDTYNVRVEKDGYHSWEKNLEVQSNLTTFSRDIVLFKKSLAINLIEGNINIFAVSPNQEKIIYSKITGNNEELRLYNTNNNSDFLIKSFSTQSYNTFELVGWSAGERKALLKQGIGDFNQYLIVDSDTLKIRELFDLTRLNFDKVTWDETSDNYLYGLRNAVLYQIDLVENSTTSLLSSNILDFLVRGGDVFYLTKIGLESFLNKSSLSDQTVNDAKKIKLPSPSEFSFSQSAPGYLTLRDQRTNDLFVVQEQAFTGDDPNANVVLQEKAKQVIWSRDNQRLVYYTDFEIWVYDFTNNEKMLVTRVGEIINQVLWYPRHSYLIYQNHNKLHAIEAKERDPKNSLQLAEFETISAIAVDGAGRNIFMKAKIGSQSGIFQLTVQ